MKNAGLENRTTVQDLCKTVGISHTEYKRVALATEECDAGIAKRMLQMCGKNLEKYNGQHQEQVSCNTDFHDEM